MISVKHAIYKQLSVVDFLDDQSKETRANAEKGSSDGKLKLALLRLGTADYEINNNYDEVMSNLKKNSDKGKSFSAYLFNTFKDRPSIIESLLLIAASHFNKLGKEGDVSVLFIYGSMLRNGFGVEHDLNLSLMYFNNALICA